MIITTITLKDWKHLKNAQLAELRLGVNVIHGPNKAGKSTIAEAVRIALVDRDHSATAEDVRALKPWTGGDGIPTAEIGFIVGDTSWRLEKRFSKNMGGGAELYEGLSTTPIFRDREVTGQVARLLGISNSGKGLGGLLWPRQGDATLPDVDQPLGDALRGLLGVQISQGDMGFQGLLDERLKLWFTPTGKPTRDVGARDAEVEKQRETVKGLRDRRDRNGELVYEHADKQAEHVKAHKAAEDMRKTIAELDPRVKALDGRKQKLKYIERRQSENTEKQQGVQSELNGLGAKAKAAKQAEEIAAKAASVVEPIKRALDACESDLRQADEAEATLELQVQALAVREAQVAVIQQRQTQNANDQKAAQTELADLKKKAEDLRRAVQAANEASISLNPLKQALDRAEAALKEAGKKVSGAQAADTDLRKLETRWTKLRELAELERALPGKSEAIGQAREIDQRLTALRRELAEIGPCDEAVAQRLEALLNDLREVEAGLRAAAMTVTLTPEAKTSVGISADGEDHNEALPAWAAHSIAVLQDAELRLAGWGTVLIKRGEASGTLSQQQAQRDSLRAELDAMRVKLALGQVEQGKWLSELAGRAATRESKDKEAKKLAKDLKKQAPEGVEALVADLQREEARLVAGKQAAGLEGAASVIEALAALGDLAARRDEVSAAQERAIEERDMAQAAHDTAAGRHMLADRHAQELKGKADAARRLLEDAHKRTGGEEALNSRLETLAEAARGLADELDKAQLTEVEKRLPDKLEAARETRSGAQKRLDEAQAAHKAAVEVHERAKSDVQAAQAVLEAEIKRTGGEDALNANCKKLQKEEESLADELAAQQLTPEEERLAATLGQEREALKTREKREREISDRLRQIEGELAQFEGLHAQLAAAEQKLAGMEAAREREALDAGAHKLIDDWFKQERDRATERSLAPVIEHVQRWLRVLNNADGANIEFSVSSLKAESLRVGDQNLSIETATSYGEREQLGTLVRLAYACVLAKDEPQAVILDDPLAHSDSTRHRRMLDVLADAGKRNLQIIVLTCHPDRFDQLAGAHHVDLEAAKAAAR